jgi:hypothetical protein
MADSATAPAFSDEERNRIITDIMHWKCELEYGEGFPPNEFRDFVDELRELGDQELKQFWENHVGEWLASRDDLDAGISWEEEGFDSWLASQFEKLTNGETTDYGFVVSVVVQQQTRGDA